LYNTYYILNYLHDASNIPQFLMFCQHHMLIKLIFWDISITRNLSFYSYLWKSTHFFRFGDNQFL